MPWLLDSKRIRRAVLIATSVCVMAAADCGFHPRLNEEFAIGAMIRVREAEQGFKAVNGRYGTLPELTVFYRQVPSRDQFGYEFTVRTIPGSDVYVAVGIPTRFKDRSMSLYLDQSGVIRGMYRNGGEADVNDPPLKLDGGNP